MTDLLSHTTPAPAYSLAARLAAVLAGLALAVWSPGAMAAWDLQQLMDTLAQTKSGRATFIEKKHIALLDKPVESSGELLYTAPDRLEKRTLKPRPESMVVNGGELVIERGRQKYQLQLQAYPELAAFIDSIRGTLAGDRGALERSYRLSLEGSAERWTLQLQPLDPKMQAVIQRIRISGVRNQVRGIDIAQADGDSSSMAIEQAAP
ncbi:outer membrane lipoprotein-sorting protein [Polaromonas sp. CF318]|jgi:outer membrane lipoprotein-sorting protein|uniref:LolA-related protein n=1 Tax=Polaromonas sp. CF318 TaxID=1144318 RepID=UPI000270F26E|nr:LolA-related protein [Polaromonas sp. CF318]EJL80656.1 outer membrane lipoprotein-sorting protein [Polaromonas sp. CF318]